MHMSVREETFIVWAERRSHTLAVGLGWMFPFSPLGNLNQPTQIQDVQNQKAVAFHFADLKMQERDKNVHVISMQKSQRIFTSLLGKICSSERSPSQFFMETEKRVMTLMRSELTRSVHYPAPDVPIHKWHTHWSSCQTKQSFPDVLKTDLLWSFKSSGTFLAWSHHCSEVMMTPHLCYSAWKRRNLDMQSRLSTRLKCM